MTNEPEQQSAVSAMLAMQGADAPARNARSNPGAEAKVWTERMHARELACALSALVNGVQGGKWYALIDKVYAPKTLALASWRSTPSA